MRYTTVEAVRLTLRVPEGGAASWTDSTYDSLLAECIAAAELEVDALCDGWAPFDVAPVAEDRSFRFDDATNTWPQVVTTGAFTVAPTAVLRDGHPLSRAEVQAQIPPRVGSSGKNLVIRSDTRAGWWDGSRRQLVYGHEYEFTGGTWGWAEVPAAVRLATNLLASRRFMRLRNTRGVIDLGDNAMYEPRYDSAAASQLALWLAPGLV